MSLFHLAVSFFVLLILQTLTSLELVEKLCALPLQTLSNRILVLSFLSSISSYSVTHWSKAPSFNGKSIKSMVKASLMMVGVFLNPVGVPSNSVVVSHQSLDRPIERQTPRTQDLGVFSKRHIFFQSKTINQQKSPDKVVSNIYGFDIITLFPLQFG